MTTESSKPDARKVVPDAWRWRAKGASVWIYDPDPAWLAEQGDSVEKQPLFVAAPAAPAWTDAWQPIETAPKDNKVPLLLAHFNTDTGELTSFDFDGIWDHESSGWEDGDRISYFWASAHGNVEEPTHWLYQPAWFDQVRAGLAAAAPAGEKC